MAYIGAVAPGYDPTRASVPQLDAERFSGDASTTAFTLTRQVVSPTDIDVIVENVTQEPTVAYSVNGYTLTFTGAPGSGTNNIYVIYRASAVSNYAFVPDGSITYAKLANNIRQFTVDTFTANGTGSTVALTETPASANSLIVSVDGVIQTAPTNYTLSGSTITFTGVPTNGANVVVKHIGFRTTSTVTALQASSVTATEIADGSVTNAKIVSVANTKISGNIVSSQITSVANTQITGNLTATNIAGGSNGTIPYQSASGTTQMLAVGTAGQLLQTNGAGAPSWTTVSSGFTLGTPVVTTSGTSVTFTGIPAGVKQVVISFLDWSTNANENRQIQLGDSGGIEITGYKSTGLTIVNPGPTTALGGYTDAFMVRGTTAVQQLNGSVILTLGNSANNTWVAQGILTDGTSEYGMFFVGGSKSLSAVLTQIRIKTESTSTFDGGEINIAYI